MFWGQYWVLLLRELRAKDLERLTSFIDDLKAREKRGLTKDQKEELACAQKVKDFLDTGVDVRYIQYSRALSLHVMTNTGYQHLQAMATHLHVWGFPCCPGFSSHVFVNNSGFKLVRCAGLASGI